MLLLCIRIPASVGSLGLYYLQFPDRAQYNFMLSLTGIGWTENYGTKSSEPSLEPPGLGRTRIAVGRAGGTLRTAGDLFNRSLAQGLRLDGQYQAALVTMFGRFLVHGAAGVAVGCGAVSSTPDPLFISPQFATGQNLSRLQGIFVGRSKPASKR